MGIFGGRKKNVKATVTVGNETRTVEVQVNGSDTSIVATGTIETGGGNTEPFTVSIEEAPARQAGCSGEVYINKSKLKNYFK
jgi:ribosomal protein S9